MISGFLVCQDELILVSCVLLDPVVQNQPFLCRVVIIGATEHFFKVLFLLVVFRDMVSLYSLGCPGTFPVRQGWPQTYRDLLAFASRVLGLKAFATTTWL